MSLGPAEDELGKFADNMYLMYTNYRVAGFDALQALKLTSDFATTLMTASLKNQEGDR